MNRRRMLMFAGRSFSFSNSGLLVPQEGLVADYRLASDNLLLWSEDLTQALWNKSQITATKDGTTDPLGRTATLFTEDLTNNAHSVNTYSGAITSATTANTPYTVVVRAKAVNRFGLRIKLYASADGGTAANVIANLQTGTLNAPYVTGSATVISSSIKSLGNGWYEIVFTGIANTTRTTSIAVDFWLTDSNYATSYVGNGLPAMYLAGLQLNEGSFPLPYIKTTDQQSWPNFAPGAAAGTALQRGSTAGSDTNDPALTGSGWKFDGVDDKAISTVSTPSVMTVMVLHNTPTKAGIQTLLGSDGTSGVLKLHIAASGKAELYKGGVAPIATSNSLHVDSWTVTATSLDAGGNCRLYKNGNTDGSATNNLAPYTSLHFLLGTSGGANNESGLVSRLLVYNRTLSAVEVAQAYRALKSWGAPRGITLP